MNKKYKIGVISDTHGYLSPKIFTVFKDVDHIVHAGDIGKEEILVELRSLAPVTAVTGNVDGFNIARKLHSSENLEIAGHFLEITHIPVKPKKLSPQSKRSIIKIFGHTHHPEIWQNGNLVVINPGSASQPRKAPAPSVAVLYLEKNKRPDIKIVYL
ncbi:MAG: YfcE family phosphodiesterase [Actinobacteria bacterium]|nr:YfcE family phosphodiesterase [Actinomycetota bacterium]